MGVRHHRDLRAWQFAHEVRGRFIAIMESDRARRDFDFRDQANTAANSACRNIAEGFWRYQHKEFAQFVNIARGSLGELLDSADEALQKRYVSLDDHRSLNALIERAIQAAAGLHTHLRRTSAPSRSNAPAAHGERPTRNGHAGPRS
jgi:four helix bundle protein